MQKFCLICPFCGSWVKWWSWWNGEVNRVELNLGRGILELPVNPTFKDLKEKADIWDDNIQKNHLVNGQIVTKTINGNVEEIGDSAIWTGLYIAAVTVMLRSELII